ncbi:MAG: PH domain-containing protein [Pseudomonadota bacterium]
MTDVRTVEDVDSGRLTPLDPHQKAVLRVRSIIAGLVPLIILSVGASILEREAGFSSLWIIGAGIFLYMATILLLPERRYRRWGYRQEGQGIRIASGLIVRRETVVPYDRVQHIDISRGPIERFFGVAMLTLHTAGSYNSTVDLPGLAHEDAERMRDEIRTFIRHDLP